MRLRPALTMPTTPTRVTRGHTSSRPRQHHHDGRGRPPDAKDAAQPIDGPRCPQRSIRPIGDGDTGPPATETGATRSSTASPQERHVAAPPHHTPGAPRRHDPAPPPHHAPAAPRRPARARAAKDAEEHRDGRRRPQTMHPARRRRRCRHTGDEGRYDPQQDRTPTGAPRGSGSSPEAGRRSTQSTAAP